MDQTPAASRDAGLPEPSPSVTAAFDRLPSGHRHIIAVGAVMAFANSVIGGGWQFGYQAFPNAPQALLAVLGQLWQHASIAQLVVALMLAAVLRPDRSALAMTAPRWLLSAACVGVSLIWVIAWSEFPQAIATMLLGTAAQLLPLLMTSVLLWIVARRLANRAVETWAGLAVMGYLLHFAWSVVTVIGSAYPSAISQVPQPFALMLAILICTPAAVAAALVAQRALRSTAVAAAEAAPKP